MYSATYVWKSPSFRFAYAVVGAYVLDVDAS
jgi:hypothetical protein